MKILENTSLKKINIYYNFSKNVQKKRKKDKNLKNIQKIVSFEIDFTIADAYLTSTSIILCNNNVCFFAPITKEEKSVLFEKFKYHPEDPIGDWIDQDGQRIILSIMKNSGSFIFGNSFDDLSTELQQKIFTEKQKYDIIQNHLKKISSFFKKYVDLKYFSKISENGTENKIFDSFCEEAYSSFLKAYFKVINPEIPKQLYLNPIEIYSVSDLDNEEHPFYLGAEPENMTHHERLKFKMFLKDNNIPLPKE